MGEEGYDIARDMGKVRPSKDKKDATTMPVSDEVKKTQKVNKGPSAFERVKAKYGKSVMNVGKKKANEELNLTQVAEALGGYIVEVRSANRQAGDQDERAEKAAKQKAFAAKMRRIAAQEKDTSSRQGKIDARQGGEGATSFDTFDPTDEGEKQIPGRTPLGDVTKGGEVKTYNPRKGDKPPESEVAKTKRKKAEADKKQRISDTLRTAKPTDIKGGPSVKRGDPVPQEVIPVKKKPVPEIGGFQPNTFKGFRDRIKTVTPVDVIPPKGDPL